jgi:hypothetical protein
MRIIVLPTWRAANQSHCASSILAKSRSSTSMTLHLASDSSLSPTSPVCSAQTNAHLRHFLLQCNKVQASDGNEFEMDQMLNANLNQKRGLNAPCAERRMPEIFVQMGTNTKHAWI